MATKVPTTDLRMGMFVAELDRPWTDTPFLLQGFLIDSADQIAELQKHCEFVIIDRARSVGAEFAAAADAPRAARGAGARAGKLPDAASAQAPRPKGNGADAAAERAVRAAPGGGAPRRVVRIEDIATRRDTHGAAPDESGDYPGLLGRVLSGFKGMWGRERGPAPGGRGAALPEVPGETPQEFAARAALLPTGIPVQTYVNQVSVEQEAPRARAIVQEASQVLDKLIGDIKLGQSFEVEQLDEIVDDMVDSIVRNPDALMWVARLREQDISAYGHGLQVSVYLTAFGRHLGFPKPQLGQLAQVGLLLDIGKIRLPKDLLEKQGTLSPAEFDEAKKHVDYGLEILSQTSNFDGEVLLAIAQHHERMNGGGYPKGLVGSEIGVYGRMAAIVDCFAALTNHRPYAAASSSYEALRSLSGWSGEYFHEPLVQQFVSSVGVFPVGSLIELSTGEVAVVVEHSKVRRLKPRVLVITGPDKTPSSHPALLDLLYEPKSSDETVFIRRGLAAGAYGLDLKDFYLA